MYLYIFTYIFVFIYLFIFVYTTLFDGDFSKEMGVVIFTDYSLEQHTIFLELHILLRITC